MATTIESFSTELWCEIFDFFTAFELFNTFGNLNSRITSILTEVTLLYFNIKSIKDYDLASNTILPVVRNHGNVRAIKFAQEFQIEEFFIRYPFNTLQKLRFLSLVYRAELSSDFSIALLQDLSHLPSLESLYIYLGYISNYDECRKELIRLVFVEQQSFRALVEFVLHNDHDDRLIDIPITTARKQTKLKSITLPPLYLNNFMETLPSIPHVRSMEINQLYSDSDQSIPLSVYVPNLVLSNCFSLKLKLDYHFTFDDIKLLFKIIPKVRQIQITCSYPLANGDQWETLLTENCTHLQNFQLMFIFPRYDYNEPPIENPQKSFSTLFWLHRHVVILHDDIKRRYIIRFHR